jgi:predicted MFS family arabinose efflux permease
MTLLQLVILIFGLLAFGGAILVLKHHDGYWMSEAIIITMLPLVITGAMFLAATQTDADGFKAAFSVLTAVVAFIGGYAAADKKRRDKNSNDK